MKDSNFDFDTSELLSSLDKLKAKYSFDLDDDEESSIPETTDEPTPLPQKPVISIPVEEPVSQEDFTIEAPILIEDEPVAQEIYIEKEGAPLKDMSWLIDSDDPAEETDKADEPILIADEEEIKEVLEFVAESSVEEESPIEEAPAEEVSSVAWYLTTEEPQETEDEEESAEPQQDEAEDYEDILSASESVEEVTAVPLSAENADDDDDDDDFADLDDENDLVVIRHDAPKKEEEKEESPFYAAFMETSTTDDKKVKPPKPVKSQKPAKPVKEPKEPKAKKEKQPKAEKANKKPRKKLILNIVVAVALAVAIWACVFVTDIILVSNWSAPVFCAESESYSDGSKTYTGAFYQIQVSVDDDGKVQRFILPWFAKGPNGDK